jgi:superfamily II DNA or RNA helicase
MNAWLKFLLRAYTSETNMCCLDAVLDLLQENDIHPELQDERLAGRKVTAKFTGTLRKDQIAAVREMLKHEVGVLCAPTAFGKTVTAAALIAQADRKN